MVKHKHETISNLLNNSRFYILCVSVLVSLLVVSGMRLIIPADQLFYIRSQQIMGILALSYWYVALLISPLGYIVGKEKLTHITFARRAIGVSAAYFAVLHLIISLWGQLGGPGELGRLPDLFKWSLAGGLVGIIILLMMAATSFNKVISFMTFRKWKWLHRLGYIGFILVILHIWTIGTHVAYTNIQLVGLFALSLLAGLESHRVIRIINDKKQLFSKPEAVTIIMSMWIVWTLAVLAIPLLFVNYHSVHLHDADYVSEVTNE